MITIWDLKKHIKDGDNQEDINKYYEILEDYILKCSECGDTVFKIDDYALCGKEKCRKQYNV